MIESLEQEVIKWAEQKGIFDKSSPLDQMDKMHEEARELDLEVGKHQVRGEDNLDKIKGELGDVLVTAVIQAHFHGLGLAGCLNQAYQKISKRTGKMENGVFVKDE